MKSATIFILACLLSAVHVLGENISIDTTLEKPDVILAFTQPDARLDPLQEAIKSDDLDEYYKVLNSINYSYLGSPDSKTMNLENIGMKMWLFYHFTAIPLYKKDYDGRTFMRHTDKYLDIDAKNWTAIRMQQFLNSLTDKACKQADRTVKKKDLAELCSLYFSHILFEFRDYYDSDIDATQEELKKKYQKMRRDEYLNNKEQELKNFNPFGMGRSERNFTNKLARNSNRNSKIKAEIESLEEYFVEMLIENFPDNAHTVYKYINLAGYKGDEAGELIDRTVGRDAKTAYLYKGENGRRHDKKMKKQQTNGD